MSLPGRRRVNYYVTLIAWCITAFFQRANSTATVTITFESYADSTGNPCQRPSTCTYTQNICAEVSGTGPTTNCQTTPTDTFALGDTISDNVFLAQSMLTGVDLTGPATYAIEWDMNDEMTSMTSNPSGSMVLVGLIMSAVPFSVNQQITVPMGTTTATDPQRDFIGVWQIDITCDAGFEGPQCDMVVVVTEAPTTAATGGDSSDSDGTGASSDSDGTGDSSNSDGTGSSSNSDGTGSSSDSDGTGDSSDSDGTGSSSNSDGTGSSSDSDGTGDSSDSDGTGASSDSDGTTDSSNSD